MADFASSSAVLWVLVAIALLFDFLNGLHDAANSIATIVSTRVLKPRYAVLWASAFNFIAFLFFGLHVAQTVGSGIIDVHVVTDRVIFAALMGAIVWNVVTWLAGIPSSSSHALVGGLIGAGLAKAGLKVIVWSGGVQDRRSHRRLPGAGLRPGPAAGAAGLVDLRAHPAGGGRPPVPLAAVRLRLALFPRPRRQRRAEDHGHHRRPALRPRRRPRRLQCAAVGGALLPDRHGAWHFVRRMAYRAHHGLKDHPTQPHAGLLRGNRRRHHPVPGHLARRAGVDHPHHHRRHRRGGRGAANLGRAVGRGPQHRHRLDRHHAHGRPRRRSRLRRERRFLR